MNKNQEEISKMILDHLRKNPDADDNLEGISKWWLNVEKIDVSVDEVSSALECLIKKGVVSKQVTKDNQPIYKICK